MPSSALRRRRGLSSWLGSDIGLGVVVFLVALAIRIVYVLQMRDGNPLFSHPTMDELYHDQWASAIVKGEDFVGGPFFRAPLYPYFLAGIYKVFGHDLLAVRLVQAVIGALSCTILYALGLKLFDRGVAFVAGIGAASYLMLAYFDAELLLPVLEVFFDLGALLALVLYRDRRSPWLLVVAGLALGLSAATRPNILVFVPAALLWLLLIDGARTRRSWLRAGLLALAVAVPIAPITLHNWRAEGRLVLISTQGGVNFFIGNNAESDGMRAVVPGTPGDWWGGYYATIAMAENAEGRKLSASEVSDHYYGRAWDWIKANPGDASALALKKARMFWSNWEIPNNKYEDFWAREFTPVSRYLPLSFSIVGLLGLLGLFLSFKKPKDLFPLWGFVILYSLSIVAFFVTARFRMPVIPPLILLASYAVFWCVRGYRERGFDAVQWPIVVLCAAYLLVNGIGAPEATRNIANANMMAGTGYLKEQRPEKALESFDRALEGIPGFYSAEHGRGLALRDLGRRKEAIEAFEQALQTTPSPDFGEHPLLIGLTHLEMGRTMMESGEDVAAASHLREAARILGRADAVEAQRLLSFLLATSHDSEVRDAVQALELARELVKQERPSAELYDALAAALAANGEFEEASAAARRAVDLAPASGPHREEYLARQRLYDAHKPYVAPRRE